MRRTVVETALRRGRVLGATLLALVVGGSLALGQQDPLKGTAAPPKPPAPAPSSLEEMLAKALKDNPDVRVAEAKVGEAEAELNRIRLAVTQKVVVLYHALESHKAQVAAAEANLQRVQLLGRAALPAEIEAARAELVQAKAKLAQIEAEMPYLLGKQPGRPADARAAPTWTVIGLEAFLAAQEAQRANTLPRGTMADKIRKALDTPVTVNYQGKPVADILKDLLQGSGVEFLTVTGVSKDKVDLQLSGRVPLGAALQAFEDTFGVRFAVREYGILVTNKELPPGAVPLQTFWNNPPVKETAKPGGSGAPEGRNLPDNDIEGVVKAVDPKHDLVTISAGSDDGLSKGHTLEVFRTKPAPRYLGTVRILDIRPKEAVGRLIRKPHEPVQVGDRVSSKIFVD